MSLLHYNLLSEPLLSVDDPERGRLEISLPAALAALGEGREIEFAYLRAHQFHAWYAALVQIAALALHRAGKQELPRDEETWRVLLLSLTDSQVEPWCLVVGDLSKPAFFQPPVSEETLAALKNKIPTPDRLDVLITAKNHDAKAQRVTHPRPEHWVYALVTLQTMQGFLGAGNYGISRMNGGFSSRPTVGASPGLAWPKRFARDVAIWLAARDKLVANHGYAEEGGVALLWLEEWDGVTSIALKDLDPLYVEICRRVRFVDGAGEIVARTAPTKAARVAAKDLLGNTGDVWTPVKIDNGASLTVSEEGFGYRQLQEILFSGRYRLGPSAEIRKGEAGDVVLVASALTRGQGQTEGVHERSIPIPRTTLQIFADPDARADLGVRSRIQVEVVADVRRRALHPAICVLLQGAPDKANLTDEQAKILSSRLDTLVDPIFFERLWKLLDEPGEVARSRWTDEVIELAADVLLRAIESAPLPVARRYKAIAAAEGVFWGSVYKNFGYAPTSRKEHANADR
jgi:CRISPR system Cascade subunit CasA